MAGEVHIACGELERRRLEVLEDVAEHGTVYLVTAEVPDTRLVPAGMVLDDRRIGFVLGPEALCGPVLGLTTTRSTGGRRASTPEPSSPPGTSPPAIAATRSSAWDPAWSSA